MMNDDRIAHSRQVQGPSRRQLLAFGASVGTLAWLGPKAGWTSQAYAATPPAKPAGQAVIGLSQEPTVFNRC